MRGLWTALITPFDDLGHIDYSSYKRILQDQVKAHVTGVIPCGTTGESPTLSLEEKKKLILTTLSELKGTSVQVAAGTGSNNTAETLEFSKWAVDQGISKLLLVTPYYNKPTQAGLINHFEKIADAIPSEIILYNVPGRTGVSLTSDTIAKLAAHPQIRTLKEATGNSAFTSEILENLKQKKVSMDILSGDDPTFLPLLSVGAVGAISVASNLIPEKMVALLQAYEKGNVKEALVIHQNYYPLFRDLFIESNPIPIKFAMSYRGLCKPHLRLPLVPLLDSHQEQLIKSLKQCDIKKGI